MGRGQSGTGILPVVDPYNIFQFLCLLIIWPVNAQNLTFLAKFVQFVVFPLLGAKSGPNVGMM
jgi:hypothetical protein